MIPRELQNKRHFYVAQQGANYAAFFAIPTAPFPLTDSCFCAFLLLWELSKIQDLRSSAAATVMAVVSMVRSGATGASPWVVDTGKARQLASTRARIQTFCIAALALRKWSRDVNLNKVFAESANKSSAIPHRERSEEAMTKIPWRL